MDRNLILATDSYKASHFLQYPPNTKGLFSYLESRGGRYGETVFFGLQYILKEYLAQPVTYNDVIEAKEFFAAHGEPFNEEAWLRVIEFHNGHIPVEIRAVPEGSVIPVHNVLMTVESTDPELAWMTSYIETLLMRVWYPITVATQSWHIRQLIKGFLEKTGDDAGSEISFKLHDFGARGVSSGESAAIGGAAHLVNFMGSDTVEGVMMARKYYEEPMAGFSIPATEHSTITSWGKAHEVDAFRNAIKQFGGKGKIFACVSDSYDLWNAITNLWGTELINEIRASGATLVVRPDSGDPASVVVKTLQLLDEKFGSSYNTKSFKVLNNVRVIQGDGVNEESIRNILRAAELNGFSASNIAFGMGGALLQQVNRDTQRFAYKCSARLDSEGHGQWEDVFKDPVTDPGKRSQAGRLDLVREQGAYKTVTGAPVFGSELHLVYRDGELFNETTFAEIRERTRR